MLTAFAVGKLGLVRLAVVDPTLLASGQLVRVLRDWSCLLHLQVYALQRRTPPMPARTSALINAVADGLRQSDSQMALPA